MNSCSILIFGASGDLTSRKLIPALYQLSRQDYLKSDSPVIGVARRDKSDEEFRAELRESVKERIGEEKFDVAAWTRFEKQLFYRRLEITDPEDYDQLKKQTQQIEATLGGSEARTRVVYLATAPSLFAAAVEGLHAADMIPDRTVDDQLRVVVEKPFGHDLASAQELTEQLAGRVKEDQI